MAITFFLICSYVDLFYEIFVESTRCRELESIELSIHFRRQYSPSKLLNIHPVIVDDINSSIFKQSNILQLPEKYFYGDSIGSEFFELVAYDHPKLAANEQFSLSQNCQPLLETHGLSLCEGQIVSLRFKLLISWARLLHHLKFYYPYFEEFDASQFQELVMSISMPNSKNWFLVGKNKRNLLFNPKDLSNDKLEYLFELSLVPISIGRFPPPLIKVKKLHSYSIYL